MTMTNDNDNDNDTMRTPVQNNYGDDKNSHDYLNHRANELL